MLAPLFFIALAQDWNLLDRAAQEHIARNQIPGAVLVVVRDNAIVYEKGFGIASTETREPITPDHLFRVGSTTKMMVAASALKLAEQGKLSLTAPAGTYIKGLDPAVAKLTLHQLLTHTAGLMDQAPMFGPQDDSALSNNVLSWKAKEMFFTTPGSVYSYSNPGYALSGALIEAAAQLPFADAVAELIFKPADMKRTSFRPTVAMTFPIAQGHIGQEVARPAANNAAYWPAGSMFTSGRDFAKFAIALLHDGAVNGKQVLSANIVKQMMSPNVTVSGPSAGKFYGYGLGVDPEFDVVEHSGARHGYASHLMLHPKQKLAVLTLINRGGANATELAHKAMSLVTGITVPPQKLPGSQSADLKNYEATYRNGPNSIEVKAAGAGKLDVTNSGKTSTYEAGAGNCFAQGAANVCFSPDAKYLFVGSRAYAR